ncbi:tryptophan halogenase family protein [Neptunicella marina]|uniref:Tryptophan 7-halogenase n=1 Tax=Neptunicella marina TaxID=2125989 RepID=A0A8J6LYZ6_9ALTE|nr:tryptophan halogenase family protein [Neptunicella marina]MBC3765710.1 tryptophan 7-halogenase [Neptunicella marina]
MQKPINKIVIVGGGTAGWMSAARLARFMQSQQQTDIFLIESADIGTVGVGEATIPNIVEFNRQLGLDEVELIKATQATFKLGVQFENWRAADTQFFHPFSDYGMPIEGVDFHQYVHVAQQQGVDVKLSEFSFPLALAAQNRFAQPHPNPPSPLADYSYAYHFDASLYASYLRDFACGLGVKRIEATIEQVNCDTNSGFIKSVTLQGGQQIDGELFIDCSGFRSLLLQKSLGVEYEDWSQWLLCDAAFAMQTERTGELLPYTRTIAESAGWQWRIPLQHRMGNGHIFSRQFMPDEQARQLLIDSVDGNALHEPRLIQFKPGRTKQIWHKNCFAVGLASGFLEPLESTSISLIQTALSKLLTFFPDSGFNQADIDEVNRLHGLELEHIRDFLILHYKLNQRDDSEFWRYCRDMVVPDSLQHKIDLYRSRGYVQQFQQDSFEPASWLSMYHGFGLQAQRVDPRASAVPLHLIEQKLQQMRQSIQNAASQAMLHQDFIAKHCSSK